MKNKEKVFSIGVIAIIIDIITKLIVSSKIEENNLVTVIPKVFSVANVKNTGAAFSIFRDGTIFLIVLSIIILIVLDRYISKCNKKEVVPLGLIVGGICGNLIDRIINHSVTDFLAFWSFPIFNIADVCIVVGVVLFIISMIGEKNER